MSHFPIHEVANRHPFAPALLDERFLDDGGIKYKEYAWAVERCAKALRDGEMAEGDIVALAAAPTIEVILTFWSIIHSGGVALMMNPKLPTEAVSHALRFSGAKMLFGSEHCGHVAAKPLLGLGRPLESVAQIFEPYAHEHELPATIVMTSGSTGDAKFVVHSLRNHIASAEWANRNIPLTPGDRWLLSLPLFHVAGIGVVMRCLSAGATVAIPLPDEELAEAILRYKATHVSLVATQLYRLLDSTRLDELHGQLKAILLGGSAIPETLIRRAHGAGLPIHTSYGMTETASQIACTPPGAPIEKLLSSGLPLAGDKLAIASDGEILAGGDSLFIGYADKKGNIARNDEPWFHSGDLGYLDGDGYLHVTGRKDNQFISGGENIQPEEIERALLALNGVHEAMVVPIEDSEWGRRPAAFVRLDDGTMPNLRVLNEALAKTLPRFKLPRAYFMWPADAPAGIKPSRADFEKRAAATRAQASQ